MKKLEHKRSQAAYELRNKYDLTQNLSKQFVLGHITLQTALRNQEGIQVLREKHNLTPELSEQVVLGRITLEAALQNQKVILRKAGPRKVKESRKAREAREARKARKARQAKEAREARQARQAKEARNIQTQKEGIQFLRDKHHFTQSLSEQIVLGHITLEEAWHMKKQPWLREAAQRNDLLFQLRTLKLGYDLHPPKNPQRSKEKDIQVLTPELKIPQSQPTSHAESQYPHDEKVVTVKTIPVQKNNSSDTYPAREPISDAFMGPTYDVFDALKWRQKREQAAFSASPNFEDGDEKDSDQEKECEDINELNSTDTPPDFLEPTASPNDDQVTLDDFVTRGSLGEKLQALDTKMAKMKPQRIRTIISQTIRKDTEIVKALKKHHNYRCQFPDCTALIPMRKGRFYVEVAHIAPVSEGGQSILGNLLVLCPNHHKEFDHGELTIREQNLTLVRGILNGKAFKIRHFS